MVDTTMAFLGLLLRRRRLVIALHVVLALAMLPGALKLRNDNSPKVFFTRDAEALARYRQFCRDFGGGKAVRLALSGSGLWTKEGLTWLGDLEERAAALPGVETAVGLAAQHRWLLLEWPPADAKAFRAEIQERGADINAGWLSGDGSTVTVVLVLADPGPTGEQELLQRIEALAAAAPTGIHAHISGLPMLQRAMDRSLVHIAALYFPILVLLAAGFLGVIFRCLPGVVLPLAFVAICQAVIFGVMGYAGVRLNLVTIILAPLIFVISLATAVHILVFFRSQERQAMDPGAAVLATYRSKARPVLWTGFTTLVAFGSLVFGSVPPIRSLGAWSAAGIAAMTLLAFTLYPVLLAVGRPQAARPFEKRARRLGRAWAGWAIRRRRLVAAVTTAAFAFALLGVAQLSIRDDLGRYFPASHPVRAELERLQRQGVGVFAAELVLDRKGTGKKEEPGFQNPSAQQRLARLSAVLRSEPLVYGAVGSGDLVEAALAAALVEGEASENVRWLTLGMMQTVPESRKLLYTFLTQDGKSARITLLLPMASFNRMQPLFARVVAEARRVFPDAEVRLTGQYPLILLAQGTLLHGMIASLSLTLLCVVLLFFVLLRSARLTLLVIVPNLWPPALVLGAVGWLKLPLDSASLMTASVVLGLAVDDTCHSLGLFLKLSPRLGAKAAIEATLERTAPAHILTSLILAAGFAAVSFSQLLPIARFGALSALAIILALLGDLLLIPALLSMNIE